METFLASFGAELLAVVECCQNKQENEKTVSEFTYAGLYTEEY